MSVHSGSLSTHHEFETQQKIKEVEQSFIKMQMVCVRTDVLASVCLCGKMKRDSLDVFAQFFIFLALL